eukprot:jgi/Botrbrau1/16003/Bobra.0353s0002.1
MLSSWGIMLKSVLGRNCRQRNQYSAVYPKLMKRFGAQGKFGPGIAVQRQDWLKTHQQLWSYLAVTMQTPGGTVPAAYHSTLNQLVQGANGSRRIQDFLWTGHKAVDLAIPGKADAPLIITPEKQAGWERERAHRFWETSSHEAAAAAASLAATGVPLRAPAPKVSSGCKATGECVKLFDKDYLKLGLRK